jgi:hypothetical protein
VIPPSSYFLICVVVCAAMPQCRVDLSISVFAMMVPGSSPSLRLQRPIYPFLLCLARHLHLAIWVIALLSLSRAPCDLDHWLAVLVTIARSTSYFYQFRRSLARCHRSGSTFPSLRLSKCLHFEDFHLAISRLLDLSRTTNNFVVPWRDATVPGRPFHTCVYRNVCISGDFHLATSRLLDLSRTTITLVFPWHDATVTGRPFQRCVRPNVSISSDFDLTASNSLFVIVPRDVSVDSIHG